MTDNKQLFERWRGALLLAVVATGALTWTMSRNPSSSRSPAAAKPSVLPSSSTASVSVGAAGMGSNRPRLPQKTAADLAAERQLESAEALQRSGKVQRATELAGKVLKHSFVGVAPKREAQLHTRAKLVFVRATFPALRAQFDTSRQVVDGGVTDMTSAIPALQQELSHIHELLVEAQAMSELPTVNCVFRELAATELLIAGRYQAASVQADAPAARAALRKASNYWTAQATQDIKRGAKRAGIGCSVQTESLEDRLRHVQQRLRDSSG